MYVLQVLSGKKGKKKSKLIVKFGTKVKVVGLWQDLFVVTASLKFR